MKINSRALVLTVGCLPAVDCSELVLDVPQASRAAAADLRKGDVVLRLNGKPAEALRDLQRLSAESLAFGTGDNARGGGAVALAGRV